MKRAFLFAAFAAVCCTATITPSYAGGGCCKYVQDKKHVTVPYDISNAKTAKLVVLEGQDGVHQSYDIDPYKKEIIIDVEGYTAGCYAYMIVDEQDRPHKLGSFTVCGKQELPATDVTVKYEMLKAKTAKLVIADGNDITYRTYDLETDKTAISINTADYAEGSYSYIIFDEQERPNTMGGFTVCK